MQTNMSKQKYGDLFSGIPTRDDMQDKLDSNKNSVQKKISEEKINQAPIEDNKNIQKSEEKKITDSDEKKETKKQSSRGNNEETKTKFKLNKKTDNSKRTRAFYISDKNYEKLTELAKENNMAISEVLNEILNQVL